MAVDTFKAANIGGNPLARGLAIMHVAMSDAVNTVQNRHTRYALASAFNPAASAEAEAAAAAAARGVLLAIAPTHKARVDAAYTAALAIWGGIHFRSALDASDTMGRQVANHLVANAVRPVR